VNPGIAFYVSYTHENGERQVYASTPTDPTSKLELETNDRIDTVIVGSKIMVIPEKLFVDANYTYTKSTSEWASNCTQYGCLFTPLPTFPDSRNTLQRLDVQAKYFLDDGFVRSAGWIGKAYVKARLLWEHNSSDAWQPLQQQLGWSVNSGDTTMRRAIFLATGDPNYAVVLGQLSFGVKW